MREGAKFSRIGVAVLYQKVNKSEPSKTGIAYETVHFLDQVGRSFSSTRVYTDSSLPHPTAKSPAIMLQNASNQYPGDAYRLYCPEQ